MFKTENVFHDLYLSETSNPETDFINIYVIFNDVIHTDCSIYIRTQLITSITGFKMFLYQFCGFGSLS